MSAKKKEKDPWTECEYCHFHFPRTKFSLHDQNVCHASPDSTDGEQPCYFGLPSDLGLPNMGFIYRKQLTALCNTYRIKGLLLLRPSSLSIFPYFDNMIKLLSIVLVVFDFQIFFLK